MSEDWVYRHQFCPACSHKSLQPTRNNTKAADFICSSCSEQYELKSFNGSVKAKVVDGAYHTMLSRLSSDTNPNFLFLSYAREDLSIHGLEVVPKHFISAAVIEPRKPLSAKARRKNWQGCNILLGQVPVAGRISLVCDGLMISSDAVARAWQRTLFLRKRDDAQGRSWLLQIMRHIDQLNSSFCLADVYAAEAELTALHPANRNVRAKIRQQLQVLRDQGYLTFVGHGRYLRT